MMPARIVFYGLFGEQNHGNECTLQALLLNLRTRLPGAQIVCVCADPADVSARHGIPGVLMSRSALKEKRDQDARGQSTWFLYRSRKLLRRISSEISDLRRAWVTLKRSHLFVIAGTGVLEDTGWSAVWYYDLLKWCVISRLRGCRICFVSVGMGPIRRPFSRLLTKLALRLADYVSYRDTGSQRFGESISLDTSAHHLFPDLAFSLPIRELPVTEGTAPGHLVVGVGVMDYYGPQDAPKQDDLHELYVERTCRFILWLVGQGHHVRMLYGDARYDPPILAEVLRRIEEQGGHSAMSRIETVTLNGVASLLSAISTTDIVVSPRYHNLVLALVLGKPAISLSYHPKNDDLLSDFGLRSFSQPLEHFDVDLLIRQFETLVATKDSHVVEIRRRVAACRRQLDRQYELLLRVQSSPTLDHPVAAVEARSQP
jgi:polysaccharide pyruvyl transferase WcaK-like protein